MQRWIFRRINNNIVDVGELLVGRPVFLVTVRKWHGQFGLGVFCYMSILDCFLECHMTQQDLLLFRVSCDVCSPWLSGVSLQVR